MEKTFVIGKKTFVLDQDKAEEAYKAKRVINGRDTMAFNLLPLKYQWAYDIYRSMKANHWEHQSHQAAPILDSCVANKHTSDKCLDVSLAQLSIWMVKKALP